ncbi:MAG: hypothetical protein Q8P73_03820 [bacterium]|nr:hypothetical protein [bacterium]
MKKLITLIAFCLVAVAAIGCKDYSGDLKVINDNQITNAKHVLATEKKADEIGTGLSDLSGRVTKLETGETKVSSTSDAAVLDALKKLQSGVDQVDGRTARTEATVSNVASLMEKKAVEEAAEAAAVKKRRASVQKLAEAYGVGIDTVVAGQKKIEAKLDTMEQRMLQQLGAQYQDVVTRIEQLRQERTTDRLTDDVFQSCMTLAMQDLSQIRQQLNELPREVARQAASIVEKKIAEVRVEVTSPSVPPPPPAAKPPVTKGAAVIETWGEASDGCSDGSCVRPSRPIIRRRFTAPFTTR